MGAPDPARSFARIIALGFSAGGHEAAGEFFEHVVPDTGLAFVVLNHKYSEVDYLSRYLRVHTDMPILEISDGLRPEANTVYVAPAKHTVRLVDGLFWIERRVSSEARKNIDAFFMSLAKAEGPDAVAIILSGMLDDGSKGMMEIKRQGGTTIVQDPQGAHYPSMPQSAIDAGVVDFVLEPRQMAALVIREFADVDSGAHTFRPRTDNLIKYFGNLDQLLASLNRPVLVLDDELRIVGFGGAIQQLIPVIDTDIGRKVANLNLELDYPDLIADVQDVFRSSADKEVHVRGPSGEPCLIRMSSGEYAPGHRPVCIVSLIALPPTAERDRGAPGPKRVAQFGIVMAHVDDELRYTWILNPHPDFSAADVVGKTDLELAQNDGTRELTELKRRVLDSGVAQQEMIHFPLSNGVVPYLVAANTIENIRGEVIGVSTVGVEFAVEP